MKILGREISLSFSKPETLKVDPPKTLPTDEQAYSQDALYTFGTMSKYNPDELIGKKGHKIYRSMMRDEQVKAVVHFKRDAITSRKFSFKVDREKLGDEEADRRLAIAEAIIDRIEGSFTDNLNGIMSSMYQGFSMTEKIYGQIDVDGKTYWGINKLKLRPFDSFEFVVDKHGNVQKVTQCIGSEETDIDLSKFIHFTHNPEYDEHYGQSELNEAYRAWFSKDMAIRFWNMWLERSASGFKWFSPMNGKTLSSNSAEYRDLKLAMDNSVNGAGLILPSNIDFKHEFPSNNVAFKEAIETHDLAISRALLVPNLMGITPSGQTGSYSQSDTQLTAFFWTLHTDTKRLEEIINEHLFKPLGEINFGDDDWPRFRFNPLTDAQVASLIQTWTQLLEKDGVTRSDSDEEYIRKLLGFPEKKDDNEDGTQRVSQTQALNGAQVASLVDIVSKATSGEISKESAIEIIVSSFPIDRKGAEDMLKVLGKVAEKPPGANPDGKPAAPANDEDDNDMPDETIAGKYVVIEAAFTRAEKRVDFAVIKNSSEALEVEHAKEIGIALFDVSKDFIDRALAEYSIDKPTESAAAVQKMKMDSALMSKVNKTVSRMLQAGWTLGEKHAKTEIDKAKKTEFSSKANSVRLERISNDFFRIKSFKVSGDLTDAARKKIEQIIINGAQAGKSAKEIEQLIYQEFAVDGLLVEQAAQALQEAIGLDYKNPQARINTMVRTNMFSAINESRYNFFTDPVMDGFVEALEFSAILDGRTTEICRHMDGQVHEADSELWSSYTPPLHYNCRSLLIPVTQIDNWTESDQPTLNPQRGFE